MGATRRWKFEEISRTVHLLRLPKCARTEEMWVLWIADAHWDNPHCNRDLLKRHLDQALELDAPIVSVGDWFCAMQGKYDKRSDKSAMRPEHQCSEYLDALVSTSADWLAPYSRNLILMTDGNHETAIRKNHETDLLERLTERLRADGGITRHGGYHGWLRFNASRGRAASANAGAGGGADTCSYTAFYDHGFGGGGPVTQGTIDFNRKRTQVRADAIICGHVHYKNLQTNTEVSLSRGNMLVRQTVHCVRCASYKDEYQDGFGGFQIERGQGPRPLGGWWQKLRYRAPNTGGARLTATWIETDD